MFNFRKKRAASSPVPADLAWEDAASAALDQAAAQAPLPGPLKGRLRRELKTAAEANVRAAGRATVTAEDLMAGLLSKLPPAMRDRITQAIQQSPAGLKQLESELKKQKG